MIIRNRHKHRVPSLNTTSTADISFMLLIFFLVVSSMDIDKGLERLLPPIDNTELQEESLVNAQNLLELEITADNQILVDKKKVDLKDIRLIIQSFVKEKGEKHLISLNTDRNASYDVYFHVQNEMIKAYRNVREDLSRKTFGIGYDYLPAEKKKNILDKVPQHLAEFYPMDEKGGQDD